MDANSPLLFFDSGVGGLSVLEPSRALLPNAPIVYVEDMVREQPMKSVLIAVGAGLVLGMLLRRR